MIMEIRMELQILWTWKYILLLFNLRCLKNGTKYTESTQMLAVLPFSLFALKFRIVCGNTQ